MIYFHHYVQLDKEKTIEYKMAKNIANNIRFIMDDPTTHKKIQEADIVGESSKEIEKIILEDLIDLGFSSLPPKMFIESRLEPDYYLPIGDTSGIIVEVEKGRTTHNNNDLLDMWKCHICPKANYLVLIVPYRRKNTKGSSDNTFDSVVRRLSSFFRTENYTNVFGVWIFGY